jgi:NAD(P)-dependent dehydrogenase (short-subunit alcohol dehydrogenase family)
VSRRVLVTGGASGLGLALARRFAARGDRVLVGDLAGERPPHVPDGVDYTRLDVRSTQDWDAVRALVEERWGGLDVLVNNAGIATGGRIDVESIADWERVLDVNLLGVVRGCQTFTPVFKRQRSGHLVNIASLAGLVHGPGMSSYNAAKAGVVALSETLDFELSPFGITTTVVCPAFFRTNLHTSLQGKDVEMEQTAVRLITGAEADADTVAAEVVRGVEAGKRLVLTDRLGRRAFWSKRLARSAYERTFRRGAEALAQRESRPPADG